MTRIHYRDGDGRRRVGSYDLAAGTCRCSGGVDQTIALPADLGRLGYAYHHGGKSYRALCDAILAKEGAEKIRESRRTA